VTERSIAIFRAGGGSCVSADHLQPREHAKDDDRSQVRRNIYTMIGELVGTAVLGGDGFNAVRRNVRFAPKAVLP